MMIALCLLAFAVGGLGRRVQGGVLDDWFGWRAPGLLASLVFGMCIAGCALSAGLHPAWASLGIVLAVPIGHRIHGFADTAPPKPAFYLWGSLYGLQIGAGAAVLGWYQGDIAWFDPLLMAVIVPAVYTLAVFTYKHLPLISGVTANWMQTFGGFLFPNYLPVGEWLTGGALGVLVFLEFAS